MLFERRQKVLRVQSIDCADHVIKMVYVAVYHLLRKFPMLQLS